MAPIHPQLPQPFQPVQPDQLFRWNGAVDGNGFVDPGTSNLNSFSMMPTTTSANPYGQTIPPPSTALARRQTNSRALVPSGSRSFNGSDSWNDYNEPPPGGYLQAANAPIDDNDNIERLEELAARAKREAQAKRKQIPPFVQKLSSFLDESRNTDLIRWSEKGDSFIVLDEDEFARTLIPELFKHNNYASFVRQLNMYGFHKRVGLSDNSMKASERKNKSPSEYYNPYFRRGHPNLLWLINKPKSGSSKKKGKKDENENESEEDGGADDGYNGQNSLGRGVSNELAPLQKKELLQVKAQIERIQQQQVAISNMLNKLRENQNQLYQQAVLFQTMHERHENSINAILNFLANVFRKSLEEQGGAQSVQELLASIIPNAQGHGQSQMGSSANVVDLGGFVNQRGQGVGTPKRQQRLLPPAPHHTVSKASSLSTVATAPTPGHQRQPTMGTVTELFDTSPADTTSTGFIENELRTNPQEGMMKLIQDTNAVNNSGIDLPDVASKTSATMSDAQRTKMLNIMAGNNSTTTTAVTNGLSPLGAAPSTTSLSSVTSPTASASTTGSTPPALSSTTRPNALSLPLSTSLSTTPFLQDIQATQAEIEELQRLQSEQAAQIDELTSLLGPLSPSGRIPGLDEHGNPIGTNYFDNVDYDQFINSNAFADGNVDQISTATTGTTNAFGVNGTSTNGTASNQNGVVTAGDTDFDFSLDGTADGTDFVTSTAAPTPNDAATTALESSNGVAASAGNGFETGKVFETTSSTSATNSPSPTTVSDRAASVGATELFEESPERGTKRRRKS